MRTPALPLVSVLSALVLALGGCGPEATPGAGASTGDEGAVATEESPAFDDPGVQRVHERMMAFLAPDDGWERTRYVQFDWIVDRGEGEPLRRSHRWDVWGGRYRVEAPVGEERMVALFDVGDPMEGERIWLDGAPVEDPVRSDSLAERAHAMFVNDAYWLLMPYKWTDEGVDATYLGQREERGETYDVVELTFDSVGLTPQNKYRAFVDTATGAMEVWQHYREASDTAPAFTLGWDDWQRYGPIRLASRRPDETGASRIRFENLAADTVVPEEAFAPPGGSATGGGADPAGG